MPRLAAFRRGCVGNKQCVTSIIVIVIISSVIIMCVLLLVVIIVIIDTRGRELGGRISARRSRPSWPTCCTRACRWSCPRARSAGPESLQNTAECYLNVEINNQESLQHIADCYFKVEVQIGNVLQALLNI